MMLRTVYNAKNFEYICVVSFFRSLRHILLMQIVLSIAVNDEHKLPTKQLFLGTISQSSISRMLNGIVELLAYPKMRSHLDEERDSFKELYISW